MRILIACEESGIVRRAARAHGHDAWSCDLKPARDGSPYHIQDDVLNHLGDGWDAMIAHPVCTRLTNAGVRWLTDPPGKLSGEHYDEETCRAYAEWDWLDRITFMCEELNKGAAFFSALYNAPIPRIVVENPVMHKYAKERIVNYRPHSFSYQPWHFATDEDGPDNVKKRICLWTKGSGFKPLVKTGTVDGSTARDEVFKCPPGPNRAEIRSTFFPGIANAMISQWFGTV